MNPRPMLRLLLFAASVLVAGAAPAPETPRPTDDPVQAELDALQALAASQSAAPLSKREHYLWFDGVTRRFGAAAFAFLAQHPADPRRWDAALLLQQRRLQPRFVVAIDENYPVGGEAAVHRDIAAAAAFEVRVAALEKELRTAPDVPARVRERLEAGDLLALYQPAFVALRERRAPDISKIEPAVRAFLARFPDSESGRGMLPMFVQVATKQAVPKTEVEVLQTFADSPNRSARDYVQDRLRFFELQKAPFELAFTALDGRQVDLKNLRGRVVLIDFWATWCGPCIAELPNVKKVYAAYHDQGFEIVSVSLDDEKDRQKFIDLVKAEGATWPQRFEGKGWRDTLVKTYTISGIPAMFLLDQNGMLVSTNARGPKLESEVRRLLKL